MTEPLPQGLLQRWIDTCIRPVQEGVCHFIVDRKGLIRPHLFLRGHWQLMFAGEGCHILLLYNNNSYISGIDIEKLFVLQ